MNPRIKCPVCGNDRFKVYEINWLQCQSDWCGIRIEITPTFRIHRDRPQSDLDKAFDDWNQKVIDGIIAGKHNPGALY